MQRHIDTVHEMKKYPCDLCNKLLSRPDKVVAHKKSVHQFIQENECLDCGKSFRNVINLKYHVDLVHQKQNNRDSEYQKQVHHGLKFERYINSVHEKRKIRLANNAASVHERQKELLSCQNTTKITPVNCDICGKEFKNKRYLVRHFDTVHIKQKYKCDICNKEFCRRDRLLAHKRAIHEFVQNLTNIVNPIEGSNIQFENKNDLLENSTR